MYMFRRPLDVQALQLSMVPTYCSQQPSCQAVKLTECCAPAVSFLKKSVSVSPDILNTCTLLT